MKSIIYSGAFLAALAAAAPTAIQKRDNIDGVILNYALTLEHLEAAFYKEGLAKYKQADFEKAGITDKSFYINLAKVGADEAAHVQVLTAVIKSAGLNATAACKYSFPYKTAGEFVALASVLEGVGVSAYLGAAASVTDKKYLTAAGSILTVEARHNAFIRGSRKQSPFPQAFDTPLDFDEVYSLAAPFIVPGSCPSSNPSLPVKAFPAMALKNGPNASTGATVTFTLPKDFKNTYDALYIAWPAVSGPVFTQATFANGEVTTKVPPQAVTGPAGQSYAILTSSNKELTDDNTIAGPAILNVYVKAP